MVDIVGKRYWYFALSTLIIVPGLVGLLLWGLNLGIDFTGGALLELQFEAPTRELQPAEIRTTVEELGYAGITVQTAEDNTVLIRLRDISNAKKNEIEAVLQNTYGSATEQRFESVGPSVGAEVTQRAIIAVIAAGVGILLYMAFAFREVPNPFRYGTCAVIAVLHDVAIVVGLAAFAGHFYGWQVDALFLTALLTVIGYSVHDTIVVFDRIRENLSVRRSEPFAQVVNHSIIQTLDRSINTQLTVLFTLIAIYLFGGVTIRLFTLWLIVGLISGTYSSIFTASEVLVAWEKGELTRWLPGRKAETPTTT